ncbi:Serine phosphatase RsbU, regulator of sigma subunit [Treponema sp. JC4]|uniref:SpoIIE family protein phosphatase n=1 Tax=Treponema sp. JC4 TaxID=1124982 RepID=UPI00025B0253|nr:SpoIIE family protein phosphatase [Treponema sp. JC4]EID85864.1 Serine phosphatase RsbU, regulator of sigma subunit [Treponema sp. JC4]
MFLTFNLKIRKILFPLFLVLLFSSCKPRIPGADRKIEVGDTFYYWESTADSTPGDVMQNLKYFRKLEDKTVNNLQHVLGKGEHYVWVKFDFTIPDYFRGQPLMLVIPHMKMAAQVWINGIFVSQTGNFPPRLQSTLFKSHFFSFPVNLLNNEPGATNTVLIKIYAMGKSGISSHSFLQPPQFAFPAQEIINFHHTRVYMFLVGTLIFTFILYICLFLCIPAFKEYRDFALMNLFTLFFLVPFFATEMPIYNSGNIPFLIFTKFTYCIPAYFTIAFATHFAFNFMHTRQPLWVKIVRTSIILSQVLITLAIPSYDKLVDTAPLLFGMLLAQGSFAVVLVIINFHKKEKRRYAILFSIGFSPLIITTAIDIARRVADHTQTYTFIALFGWLFSIVCFIITLSVRFARLYVNNEKLTNHLQEEVDKRTQDLKGANYELSVLNERLEKEKFKSDMDLQMASLVQQRFFPQPNKHFRGWEIAIFYNPQAIVSGDLYDYYNYNETLNGLSLFDVSGHGISASLVTMLSKNIISHAFQKGYRQNERMDSILKKINNIIIYEKGDIDNYMTGLLCRFKDSENSDNCNVEIGNAGHPYPLKYCAKEKEVIEIRGTDNKKHYGAIGMQGIAVSFAKSEFEMTTGDILVCYTDGITEAANANQEQFGTGYIKQILKDNPDKSSSELLSLITDKLTEFTKDKPLEDDITVIIAKRTDPKKYVPDETPDEEPLLEPKEELEELSGID